MRRLLLATALALTGTACVSDEGSPSAPATTEVATHTLEPAAVVYHVDERSPELPPAVHIGVDGIAELRALVLRLDPEADVGIIDDADPDESFFVSAGYYCGDGGRVLDVRPTELATYFTQVVSCESPNPALTLFEVDRTDVESSFQLTSQFEWEDALDATIAVRVEDWAIVG